MDINVTTREINETAAALEVAGEIDVYASPSVKEAINGLIDKNFTNLIISLEEVRYIDSTGLGVLIGALKKIREKDGKVLIVCGNPQLKKIFNITGLVRIFSMYETMAEAEKALG